VEVVLSRIAVRAGQQGSTEQVSEEALRGSIQAEAQILRCEIEAGFMATGKIGLSADCNR